MTDADRREFAICLGALAETLQHSLNDVQAEGYWRALVDLPLADVQAAAAQAMKHAVWMPRPSEVRNMALAHREQQARAALPPSAVDADDPRTWFHCRHCEDVGWVFHTCRSRSCGRRQCQEGHSYVSRCPCAAENPTLQRARMAQADRAKARETKKQRRSGTEWETV